MPLGRVAAQVGGVVRSLGSVLLGRDLGVGPHRTEDRCERVRNSTTAR